MALKPARVKDFTAVGTLLKFQEGRQMWKPGVPSNRTGNRKPLMALIRSLTNGGELMVEFCVRIILGQDLRLAQDWKPVLRATRKVIKAEEKKNFGNSKGALLRMKRVQRALALLPSPPEITMDDRRWAVQTLLAYGWGLPGRAPDPPLSDAEVEKAQSKLGRSSLALKAAEYMAEFEPKDEIEAARLQAILRVIEQPVVDYERRPDGTFLPKKILT